ncbi:MAG: adenylosuccinate synthetase [Phaeodactylibacter sp.]|nr:adenylosuccinate synthetase [Phaeodactylibacter sp.]
MRSTIILGLGYGDEGKGLATDYLCRQSGRPLVIRFSGGHQAGHTVVADDGRRHVFSSFGSGTFRGAPTYWSRFCTFYPIAFLNEWEALRKAGIQPKAYVDALAPVTTPYDVFYNRATEKVQAHGSCGVGFGATVARQETPYKLFVQDLSYPGVLEQKLRAIRQYYEAKTNDGLPEGALAEEIAAFRHAARRVLSRFELVQEPVFFAGLLEREAFGHFIFEGSQGILLDMDHGFFPHVTRAHTTSRNALQLVRANGLPLPVIYYITRAYQARHGNGPLTNEGLPLNVLPNPRETNRYNEWQGRLRRSVLDLDMLQYALQCNRNYSGGQPERLAVTCLDQVEGRIRATRGGKLLEFGSAGELATALGFPPEALLESWADRAEGVVRTGAGKGVEINGNAGDAGQLGWPISGQDNTRQQKIIGNKIICF